MLSCLFIAALWSPDWKGLTSLLSCMWCFLMFLSLPMWCPGSGVVLDSIDSWSLPSYLHWRAILIATTPSRRIDYLLLTGCLSKMGSLTSGGKTHAPSPQGPGFARQEPFVEQLLFNRLNCQECRLLSLQTISLALLSLTLKNLGYFNILVSVYSVVVSLRSLNKLKSKYFLASSASTYFSTLYTTLPHNLMKEKLTELIEQIFNREGSLYLVCNMKRAFFTSEQPKRFKLWSCHKVCNALHYLLDNIFIRFGSKLYRQIVGIPMGTNCAPLVADLFLLFYERDFMLSLSDNNQADVVEAFNSTPRYQDDLLNIDNPFFCTNGKSNIPHWTSVE